MQKTFVDLTGRKFGTLTAMRLAGSRVVGNQGKRFLVWACKCDCGKSVDVIGNKLKTGHVKSCGCATRQMVSATKTRHGENNRVTGMSPEYRAWYAMKTRCGNPKQGSWRSYGGRGIKVCDRWARLFENFLEDMGRKPSPSHSLDRIDVNGNYEPSNCRWATPLEQRLNQRPRQTAQSKAS